MISHDSCVAGDDVVSTVPSGGTTEHNTRHFKKYDVPSANFCLCDTWGLDKKNYQAEHKVLPALLEGWLPSNWKMEYHLRDHKTQLLANDASRYQRRVHAVLFFVTAGAVHDDTEMDTIKDSFQKVCSFEPQHQCMHCSHIWSPFGCLRPFKGLVCKVSAFNVIRRLTHGFSPFITIMCSKCICLPVY